MSLPNTVPPRAPLPRSVVLAIAVAALGYFVDVYDLILFNVVRWESLTELGLSTDDQASTSVWLLNLQLIGMLVGGIMWGVLGDLRGRLSVLFGSIILYSVANLLNAGVGATEGWLSFMGRFDAITAYAVLRFVAGVGLAGELGAGVTLVAEITSRNGRGVAVTLIGAVGVVGAVVAGIVGESAGWRHAYTIGGLMGLALLILRIGVVESGLYSAMGRAEHSIARGFIPLASSGRLIGRLALIVFAGMPIWFTLAVIVGLAPRIAQAMGVNPTPAPGTLVALYYGGAIFGDLASGFLSQRLRSRTRAMAVFMAGAALACALVMWVGPNGAGWYGAATVAMGFFSGYWIVIITTANESFGTNVRATVTTMTPNLIRVSALPVTLLYTETALVVGPVASVWWTGGVCFVIGAIALAFIDDPFGRDLDFIEP